MSSGTGTGQIKVCSFVSFLDLRQDFSTSFSGLGYPIRYSNSLINNYRNTIVSVKIQLSRSVGAIFFRWRPEGAGRRPDPPGQRQPLQQSRKGIERAVGLGQLCLLTLADLRVVVIYSELAEL